MLRLLVATAALFAVTAPAVAASRADWDACKGDDPDRSIAACTRIIQGRGETAKNSAIAHHERGLAYRSKGDFDRAIADLSEAVRLDPKYAEAYYGRGLAYGNKDDLDRAIADYSEAIRLKPRVPAVHYNRGKLYQLQGNNDRAIADFSEAIRLDPKFAAAYNNRGFAYLNQGRTDRAIADFDEAIRLDPKFADAYSNRGKLYQLQGNNDRAIADLSEAIRLDPKLASAYNDRGNAYGARGNIGRAIADFDEAIRLEPKYAVAYNNRGFAYLTQGRIAPAIADFSEAIRLEPKFVFAYSNRGHAYRVRGNNYRAIADLSEAIRLEPKFVSAYIDRGNAYRARGDNDHAIADFSEAIRLDPKSADAYYNRGLAYLYSGDLAKALADVSEASELAPQDAYKALWADILAQRNNAASRLSQASAQIDMTPWPGPIIRMFLGRMPPEAVLAAADLRCQFLQRRIGAAAQCEGRGGAPVPAGGERLRERRQRMVRRQCGAQGAGRGALNEPAPLRRQHLEHVAVRISEIKTASATTVIHLHIVERAGSAAISNALGADSVEDAVKLCFIDFEGVVVTLELRIIVEIEGQRVVDPQRREVRERTFIAQTQDPGEEARRCFLVMRRDDRMVEHNCHRHLLAGDSVIASEIGRCVADFKARRARRLRSSRTAEDRASSMVVDRNRRHLIAGMAIDKPQKG